MTYSEAGFSEHPEVDEISAYLEDQLAERGRQAVEEHLGSCPSCADVLSSLESVRTLLGEVPDPGPMPPDVSDRITAALSSEADATGLPMASTSRSLDDQGAVAASEEIDSLSDATVSRETVAVSDRRHEAVDHFRDNVPLRRQPPERPRGRSGAPTGPGRLSQRRKRRRMTLLATAGAVGALGLGSLLMPGLSESPANRTTEAGDSSAEAPSQQSQDQALGERVHKLLSEQNGTAEDPRSPSAQPQRSTDADTPLQGDSATAVPSCVTEGIGRDEEPLASDANSPYKGRNAYLVVLPHPGDPGVVDAYLVDPRCSTGAVQGPAEVFTKHTYPRG